MKIRILLSIDQADAIPVIRVLSSIEALALVEPEKQGDELRHELAETLEDQETRFGRLCRELDIEADWEESYYSPDPARDVEEAGELLEKIEEKLSHRQKTQRRLKKERESLRRINDDLQCLESAGISLPTLNGSRYLVLRFGWISADQREQVKCPALRNPLLIIPLLQKEKRLMIAATTIQANEYVLQRVLESLFFEAMEIDDDVMRQASNDPEERLRELERRLNQNDRAWQNALEEWREQLISLRQRIREDVKNVRLLNRYGRSAGGKFCHFLADIPEEKGEDIFQTIRQTATRPHALFAGRALVEVD